MKRKKRKIIAGILIAQMAGLIIFSGVKLLQYLDEKAQVEEQFDTLSRMTDTERSSREDKEQADGNRLKRYQKIYEQNPDFIGWLRIEGTNINYPVMQSGTDDPEFYLDHDFNKDYSVYGVPFADAACKIGESNNVILYGHHMTSETMFHEITYYEDPEFLKDHKRILFDTLGSEDEYEVIAVFRFDTDHESFRFNRYTDMDMKTFAEFMKCVHERELYNTGLDAVFGEKLLTLSTCDYVYNNGRFVVVAKEVD
ncbi:MAG: class B sortase [Parasporobacterium sp.]|nr:class B sortase [Parasporobacterium sp.]